MKIAIEQPSPCASQKSTPYYGYPDFFNVKGRREKPEGYFYRILLSRLFG